MYDPKAVEAKWQQVWHEQKTFEPDPKPGQKKFLGTFPYPYVNGLPHVGHLFSMMRTEAFVRYKRAQGYNALFPQGWHCTGSPIVNAAKLVEEGDAKQIQILKDNGVPESEIEQFKDPLHWIKHFPPRYGDDIRSLGMSIDWRREFITTSLNPRYDKFIRWQFKQLKEKGYVALGKHPVVWCPKEHAPVSDHARRSGEGETPQEFTLIAFALEDSEDVVAVATLRPETISGVTNLWVHPNIEYVRAQVDGKHWIISKPCVEKLIEQEHTVKVLGAVAGKDLIGKYATHPATKRVPLLPATFPTADKGTGLVMSVPSDAPDDYIALRDLQHNEKQLDEFKLHRVKDITPIAIIDAGELGHTAAVKVVEDMKIQNQKERDRLDVAKKLVYKKGYYEGIMLHGEHAGMKVEKAKDLIKEQLLASGHASKFYELTGPVVCRCLTPCVVKVVQNQWFITYGNQEWKQLAHACLNDMKLYPEKARQQFDYVLDWLNDWACTREEGLGTRLPWDEHWLIESLSDSTLYNAYYTIVHLLQDIPETHITDELFDYVLLGKGAPQKEWSAMRESFLYWYPVDFRNSGKDLIQNHLAFMIFNHVAIFPQEHWPKGYGVNGHVTVDGQKMSKSIGNVIPVRAMVAQYGADASRLTILNGGEGLDDPNWDSSLAAVTQQKLGSLLELIEQHNGKGRSDMEPVDEWLRSKLHSTIKRVTEAMEQTQFRTALQGAWFELSNLLRQYLKLTNQQPNKDLFREALQAHVLLLQPFTPHVAEEAWQRMGNPGLASTAHWPQYDEACIRPELEASQDMIEQLTSDIRSVQQLVKLDRLKEVTVIVATEWKFDFVRALRATLRETRHPGEVLKAVLAGELKAHAGDITKLVPVLLRDPGRLPSHDSGQAQELRAVEGAAPYLHKVFGAAVTVVRAEDSHEKKAGAAFPGKPAILLS